MIVSESDLLLAALDRRMAVDRTLPLDPLSPVARGGRATAFADPRTARAAAAAARLPLGRTVTGQVLDVLDENHLLVDVESVPLALAWPQNGGPAPSIGQNIALRVLAHTPMLLFETVALSEPDGTTDAPTHLSPLARELQRSDGTAGRTLRFDTPILTASVAADAPPGPLDAIPLERIVVGTPTAMPPPRTNDGIDPANFMPLVLQGPAWQGQPVEIVLRRERGDPEFESSALDQWCGELVIDLPQLGRVSGRLSWSVQGLRLRLDSEAGATVEAMNEAGRDLVAALLEAQLPVLAFSVGGPSGSESSR
jgi:hypothetical protein